MTEIKMIEGIANAPEAREIRSEVFMGEQGFSKEFDRLDDTAVHAVVYSDGRAAATGRLFKGRSGWHIGRVSVRKEFRGAGLGGMVVRALEEKAKELGAEEIKLSAQVQAMGFYESLGYIAEGEEFYDEHCPHIAMRRTL